MKLKVHDKENSTMAAQKAKCLKVIIIVIIIIVITVNYVCQLSCLFRALRRGVGDLQISIIIVIIIAKLNNNEYLSAHAVSAVTLKV